MCADLVRHEVGYPTVQCISVTLEGRPDTATLNDAFVRAAVSRVARRQTYCRRSSGASLLMI
jgi:hypothetical protein